MKKIGKRLQELRESKGLSQSDLASYLGISQPLLSQIESGNRNLNLSLLDKLCSLYGCSDSYILCKSIIQSIFHSDQRMQLNRIWIAFLQCIR